MSLDIYLYVPIPVPPEWSANVLAACAAVQALRGCMNDMQDEHEIDRALRDAEFALDCLSPEPGRQVFHRNVTHNLAPMARAAGLYLAMWRPDEMAGLVGEHKTPRARMLVDDLERGLRWLADNEDAARALTPANGWGSYDGLVDAAKSLLRACREHPDAIVRVSR